MSRDQLIATAAELGIPPEAVLDAERAVKEKKASQKVLEEFSMVQRARFWSRVSSPIVIGLAFIAVFAVSREAEWWALIPAAVMFLAVVKRVPEHFMPGSEPYNSAFERWKRKRGGSDS